MGAADPGRVESATVVADHLLLGPTQEVAGSKLHRPTFPGLGRGQGIGVQEPPESEVGVILAHVRRRREKQQVPGAPAQAPAGFPGGDPGQGLGHPVAAGPPDAQLLVPIRRELVGLVEDHEIVGLYPRVLQAPEGALGGQGVQTDDHLVGRGPQERIAGPSVAAADDSEPEAEETVEFALPVPDQAGRRDDQDSPHQAPAQHLPQVEPGHHGLAGPGIIGQKEPDPRLGQEVFVHGDPLVWQGVDRGTLGGEGRVELVAVAQPMGLGYGPDLFGVGYEVERYPSSVGDLGLLDQASVGLLEAFQAEPFGPHDPLPGQGGGRVLPVLPAVHSGERQMQQFRELLLGQVQTGAKPPNPVCLVGRRRSRRRPPGERV